MTVNSLNLGQICAYYGMKHSTMEMFAASLTPTSRVRAVLDVLAASSEFSALAMRGEEEERELVALHEHVPIKISDAQHVDAHVKTHLLLQAHFSRLALSDGLRADLCSILPVAFNLLTALVDVVASQGWWTPVMAGMRVCQMIVQGVWDSDHPLKQLDVPPVEGISSIYEFIELSEDEKRAMLEGRDASTVAVLCNRYPAPGVSWQVIPDGPYSGGQVVQLRVRMEVEYGDDDLQVPSLRYPIKHFESWWIVITDMDDTTIRSIKRITGTSAVVEGCAGIGIAGGREGCVEGKDDGGV